MRNERTGSVFPETVREKRKDGTFHEKHFWKAEITILGKKYSKRSKQKEAAENWLFELKKSFEDIPVVHVGITPRFLDNSEKIAIITTLLYEKSKDERCTSVERKAYRNLCRRMSKMEGEEKIPELPQRPDDVWTENVCAFLKAIKKIF